MAINLILGKRLATMLPLCCTMSMLFSTATSPLPTVDGGAFQTLSGDFTVGGLVGGGSNDSMIYSPVHNTSGAPPSYNVISFGHGATHPKRGVGDGKLCYRGDLESLNGTSW
jgi:hypothetical protein